MACFPGYKAVSSALSRDPAVISTPPVSLTRQFETQGLSDLPKVTRLVRGAGGQDPNPSWHRISPTTHHSRDLNVSLLFL